MTDNKRRVEAFLVLFGAVTIPYSGVLGSLLAPFSNVSGPKNGDVPAGEAGLIAFYLLGLISIFVAVVPVCLAVVLRWKPENSKREVAPLGVAALALMVWLLPALAFGMAPNLWRAVTGSWLICCLVLAYVCRVANMKKGIF